MNDLERFNKKWQKDGDCWIWTGATSNGYSRVWYKGKLQEGHRVSYMLFKGPIPHSVVAQLCGKRLCVNPEHLVSESRADFYKRTTDFPTPEEALWKRASKGAPDECWYFRTRSGKKKPYGSFVINGVKYLAHRLSYELAHGEIAEGLEIDHVCRHPACVNPSHLEAVTHRENIMRGRGVDKETCANGHPWTPENTYIVPSTGWRQCVACRNRAAARHRGRKAQNRTGPNNAEKTHCKHGHEFTAENTYYRKSGGRNCRTCSRRASKRAAAEIQKRYS